MEEFCINQRRKSNLDSFGVGSYYFIFHVHYLNAKKIGNFFFITSQNILIEMIEKLANLF